MARPNPSAPSNSNAPISFKTVPGRHRTQKWNVAKQYDYSGDDWGGYDGDGYEDDGGYEPEPRQAPTYQQTSPRPPQQQGGYPTLYPSQQQPSYSTPSSLPSQQRGGRQMSFDREDDTTQQRRQLSPAQPPIYAQPFSSSSSQDSRGPSPAKSAASAASSGNRSAADFRDQARRNFTNPEQVPPPLALNTQSSARSSPAPPLPAMPFPPRKASMTSLTASSPTVDSSAKQPEKEKDKALPTPPFVRPSDIYKRMAEEQEKVRRASEESGSRPSFDSGSRGAGSAVESPRIPVQRPLSAVDEGPVEDSFFKGSAGGSFGEPTFDKPSDGAALGGVLPDIRGVSTFGSEWLGGSRMSSEEQRSAQDQSTNAVGSFTAEPLSATSTNSVQMTPTATRSTADMTPHDAAAEILAERTHSTPISVVGQPIPQQAREPPSSLNHQASQGYRSAVNRAFDHGATSTSSVSRDTSQSTTATANAAEVSRSNTDSTSGISPIMSRVPSSGTTAQRIQQMPMQGIRSIAEEPRRSFPAGDGERLPATAFRRDYNPPASANSPAHLPALQTSSQRNVGDGMTAESGAVTSPAPTTASASEPPAVPDQGVEMMPLLSDTTAETPASEILEPTARVAAESISTGRARAGTDYSLRESDLADAVNSPDSTSPTAVAMSPAEAAREEKAEQASFLRTHTGTPSDLRLNTGTHLPTSTSASALTSTSTPPPQHQASRSWTNTPTSATASPSKSHSRVREIANRFQEIHEASRRNSQISIGGVSSKSSWSRFGGEEGTLARNAGPDLERTGTGGDSLVSDSDYAAGYETSPGNDEDVEERQRSFGSANPDYLQRPDMAGREESFRPTLPGGWVSYRDGAPPATQDYSPASRGGFGSDEDDDAEVQQSLAPATTASQDQDTPRASSELPSASRNVEDAQPDLTPTSRRTAAAPTTSQPSQLEQAMSAGSALGASLLASVGLGHQTRDFGSSEPPEPVEQPSASRHVSGEVEGLRAPQRPWAMQRGDTDGTDVTDVSADGWGSVPPTPPAKDSPGYLFTGAPLRTGRSREGSPVVANAVPAVSAPGGNTTELGLSGGDGENVGRQGINPPLSMYPRHSDLESDRLRKEIVQTLHTESAHDDEVEEREADAARTQDALDAPGNAQRVLRGEDALPAAESSPEAGQIHHPRAMQAPSESERRMLDQRFSWERELDARLGSSEPAIPSGGEKEASLIPTTPVVREPPIVQESSPEIRPEMPYERPRSRNLHIMNAVEDDDIVERSLSVATSTPGPVSPITKSQENLHMDSMVAATRDGGEGLSAPSPFTDAADRGASFRLPSYYMLDLPGIEGGQSPRIGLNDTGEAASRDLDAGTADPRSSTSEPTAPRPPSKDGPAAETLTTPTSSSPTKSKTPPFREILAIKSPAERIKTYDSTRRTFAETNTGLSDWLSGMLVQNPAYANLGMPSASTGQGSLIPGHRTSPSVAKFTRNFSGRFPGSDTSPANPAGGGGDYQPGHEPVGTPTRSGTGGGADMEKLQLRGKELMKNASVLGGKAQAGAKGLLAKGRRSLGSTRNKDPLAPPSTSSSRSISPSPSASLSASATPPIASDDLTAAEAEEGKATPVYLSRATSRASSYFLAPSRSQTHTPLSAVSTPGASAGVGSGLGPGGLGRMISRLRDGVGRSRDSSRSRSRPLSVVTTNLDHDLEVGNESLRADDRTAQRGTDAAGADGKTYWPDPEDWARERTVGTAEVPERLGVLPSPTAGSFSIDRGLSSRGTDAEVGEDTFGTAIVQTSPHEQYGEDEQYGEGREMSDPGAMAPAKSTMMAIGSEDRSDELYETTPKAAQRTWKTDDEMYETTPRATQSAWNDSASRERDEDARSEQEDGALDEVVTSGPSHEPQTSLYNTVGDATRPHDIAQRGIDDSISAEGNTLTKRGDLPSQLASRLDTAFALDKKQDTSLRGEILESEEDQGVPKEDPAADLMDRRTTPQDPPRDLHDEPKISLRAISADSSDATTSTAAADLQSTQHDRFMARGYVSRPEMGRPLSYEPLPRDSKGEVVPEAINKASEPDPVPAAEESAQAENEEGPSFEANFTSLARHKKASTSPTAAPRSKRLSGMFAGREVQSPSQSQRNSIVASPTGPAAWAITDNYGLGDLQEFHNDDDSEIAEEDARPSVQADRQSKRTSRGFGAFRKQSDDSRTSSTPRVLPVPQTQLAPQIAASNVPPRPTEQPTRSGTTFTEPDKKKKRFSALGSLFGRSSTTGHKPETLKKPSKAPKSVAPPTNPGLRMDLGANRRLGSYDVFPVSQGPPPTMTMSADSQPREGQLLNAGRSPVQQYRGPGPRLTVSQGPPSIIASSVDSQTREGQLLNADRSQGQQYRGPAPRLPVTQGRTSEDSRGPPAEGWYAPRAEPSSYDAEPATQPRAQNFSRPARASVEVPRNPSQQVTSPIEAKRQDSITSAENALSPQISGQSDWLRSSREQRQSMPVLSPVNTRQSYEGHPAYRTGRVGSIGEDIVQRPYPEQSAARAPAYPSSADAAQGSRTSYHYARQRRAKAGAGPRIQGRGTHSYSMIGSGSQDMINPQMSGIVDSRLQQFIAPSGPSSITPGRSSIDSRAVSTSDSIAASAPEPAQKEVVQEPEENPYLSAQLPQLTDGNRREPTGEESDGEGQMMATSYPGQEWVPGEWE